jgi:ATP-dependent DNA ligase
MGETAASRVDLEIRAARSYIRAETHALRLLPPDRPNPPASHPAPTVKYDGYRLRLEREGNRLRLITRGGHNWADRYPWIVETALKNRHQQFVIDGEAVVLDGDGIADFNALQSRRHDDKVWLYAFDILTLDGEDLRGLPLSMRKPNLARLLARRRPDGIFAAPYEQGEIGPDLFEAACNMGLEGLVSKRADRPYRAGRSRDWIKVKNRKHPAYRRVQDQF